MTKFLVEIKIWQIYTLDVKVDLSDLTISLTRNDKTFPKSEKNPSKPDLENVFLDRRRDLTVTAWS